MSDPRDERIAELEAQLREAATDSMISVLQKLTAAQAEIRELKMQALADVGQLQEAAERLPDLSDPVAVHRNMLAGTIAKPSVEAIIHIYGHRAINAALRETDGEPPPPIP